MTPLAQRHDQPPFQGRAVVQYSVSRSGYRLHPSSPVFRPSNPAQLPRGTLQTSFTARRQSSHRHHPKDHLIRPRHAVQRRDQIRVCSERAGQHLSRVASSVTPPSQKSPAPDASCESANSAKCIIQRKPQKFLRFMRPSDGFSTDDCLLEGPERGISEIHECPGMAPGHSWLVWRCGYQRRFQRSRL